MLLSCHRETPPSLRRNPILSPHESHSSTKRDAIPGSTPYIFLLATAPPLACYANSAAFSLTTPPSDF